MTQVSIILLNYNTFELTGKCIESILTHTKDVSYEIILLDNASTEKDPIAFKQRFPSLHLIQSKTNLGFAKGNNEAIKSAKGQVILLINSDTELLEDSISICYKELLQEDKNGVMTCRLVYPNGNTQHNCQSFPSLSKFVFEKLRLHKLVGQQRRSKILQGFFWDHEKPGKPDWVWGTFFMFRATLLQKLPEKKLNEDYFMYVEDMKWCFDIRQAGFDVCYSPSTKIVHHSGGSAGNTNELVLLNQTHFINKNYSRLKAWFLSHLIS